MIIHGNKQISEIVYARKASEGGGAVRLTNIIRGAQVVFSWLEKATKAAILAAFGKTDGNAVIKATNAYLNGIAATDKSKASALAGFINEDPMMVCSLGLQPQGVEMPRRWLVGDGKAWISLTDIVFSEATCVGWRYRLQSIIQNVGSGWWVHGVGGSSVNCYVGISSKRNFAYSYGGNDIEGNVSAANYWNKIVDYDLDLSRGTYTVSYQGNQIDRKTFTPPTAPSGNSPMALYCWRKMNNGTAGNIFQSSVSKAEFGHNDTIEHIIVPYKDNVMIDLLTGTKYGNANTSGSFSIAYTLPDGTPWTPPNKTP